MNIAIDRASLLVEAPGSASLRAVEGAIAREGLTLDVPLTDATVDAWLAAGAPGAPSSFADPADHLLAGLVARLRDGRVLTIHPSPRRAVGPDMTALVLGAGGRFAVVESAWLRVHRASRLRVACLAGVDLDPSPNEGERALLDAIERELGAAR